MTKTNLKNNMSEEQIFCQNVKFLRSKNNLTQKQMAQICKISVRSLRMIEKGIIPPRLSANILIHIRNYFNIIPSEMFEKLS